MTRFDAPESSRMRLADFRKAIIATLVGNPGVVLATLFITLLWLLLATALVSVAVAVPSALRSAFLSNPILVFAAPGATRVEIQALDARLKALPMVADVSLRPKEAALAALIEAGLPAAPDGRNPLPDVWTVHLRFGEGFRGVSDFVTVVVGARDAIASLPAVERVKFEDGWVTLLDRWAKRWSAFGLPSIAGCLLACALGVLGVYGLFARSLSLPDPSPPQESKLVLAFVLTQITMVSGLLAYIFSTLIISSPAIVEADILKPIADQAGLSLVITVASLSAGTLLFASLGTIVLGGRK